MGGRSHAQADHARTTLENLKKEAKRWLNALQTNAADARARFERALPEPPASPTLRDVQHALALEHGLPGWKALKRSPGQRRADPPLREGRRGAGHRVPHRRRTAMRIVWDYFGHRRTGTPCAAMSLLDLGKTEQTGDRAAKRTPSRSPTRTISWRAPRGSRTGRRWPRSRLRTAGKGRSLPKPSRCSARRPSRAPNRGGRTLLARLGRGARRPGGRQLPGLDASGQMTDALLERVSQLDHLTALDLASRRRSPTMASWLARLPRLRRLNLSGTGVTDRGLEVLRHLPALESVALAWTRVTDAGAAHLAACERFRASISPAPTRRRRDSRAGRQARSSTT